MKVTPLAAGTGVPAQSDSSLGKTADSSKIAKAKAIAAGQAPVAETQQEVKSSGDSQVDRIKKIKMRTQQSTNRDDNPVVEPVVEGQVAPEVEAKSPTQDTVEQVNDKEETKSIDPQVAAFLKAKRALQVKEREIAQREEALKTQAPAVSGDYISKADLIANPLKVFEAGVTYDQLTEAILSNQSPNNVDIKAIREQIKEELKNELKEEFTTRDDAAEQQVLAKMKSETIALVNSEGEKYEAIKTAKAESKVVDLIHRQWKATGEILEVAEAAELIENELIEDSLPFAKIKKVQSRLTPAQVEQVQKILEPPKPGTKVMRTLTNRDSASPVMDKRARAIAAMNGTLKR